MCLSEKPNYLWSWEHWHSTGTAQLFQEQLPSTGSPSSNITSPSLCWGTRRICPACVRHTGTSAQWHNEAPGQALPTLFTLPWVWAAVCPHPKQRGCAHTGGWDVKHRPHNIVGISLAQLGDNGMATQTSGSNLARGTGTRERADCSCSGL